MTLKAKEKGNPMGYGAATDPLPTLRWGENSWSETSDDEKHLLPTPQWVQKVD